MLSCILASVASLTLQEPVRGRDPWVFRCIFEDRPRTVVVALGEQVWCAFNPVTCGTHKVWKGDIDFRGKVFDFSQDNSSPKGNILVQGDQHLFRVQGDEELPQGWKNIGCKFKDGAWWFGDKGSGKSLSSATYDTRPFQTLYFAFDEVSRKGRIEVFAFGNSASESFKSMTSVDSDTNWQWNFKRLETRSEQTTFTIQTTPDQENKAVKNIRLFGDYYAWAVKTSGWLEPCQTRFLGYETKGTASVAIRFSVTRGSQTANITLRPQTSMQRGQRIWSLTYNVQKPPDMDLLMVNPAKAEWSGLKAAPERLYGVPCARVAAETFTLSGQVPQ